MPEVLTVDDIVELLRFDHHGPLSERRRHVYDLVRSGALAPIGGAPAGRLTASLRFSATSVRRLIEPVPLVVAPNPDVPQPPVELPRRTA